MYKSLLSVFAEVCLRLAQQRAQLSNNNVVARVKILLLRFLLLTRLQRLLTLATMAVHV